MPSIVAIFAALAVAGGIGALVGILVGGRRHVPVMVDGEVPRAPAALRPAQLRRAHDAAPKWYLKVLDRQLVLAGRPSGWTLDKVILGKLLLAVAGVLLALVWISADPGPQRLALGCFLVALAFFTPDLLIYSRGQERQEKIQNSLADTLDQMTISVEAGLGFEAAMAKAATNGTGPLAEEFIRTLQDMSIGRSRSDAYQALGERTSSADLRRFTRSVMQADTYGIAIAKVLQTQAKEMRLRRRQRAEEKAMKVPVKVLFPLIFCILPVLFIVLLTPAVLGIIKAFSL